MLKFLTHKLKTQSINEENYNQKVRMADHLFSKKFICFYFGVYNHSNLVEGHRKRRKNGCCGSKQLKIGTKECTVQGLLSFFCFLIPAKAVMINLSNDNCIC